MTGRLQIRNKVPKLVGWSFVTYKKILSADLGDLGLRAPYEGGQSRVPVQHFPKNLFQKGGPNESISSKMHISTILGITIFSKKF